MNSGLKKKEELGVCTFEEEACRNINMNFRVMSGYDGGVEGKGSLL